MQVGDAGLLMRCGDARWRREIALERDALPQRIGGDRRNSMDRSSERTMTRRSYPVASILAFAAAYFCAGKFGLSLAFGLASIKA